MVTNENPSNFIGSGHRFPMFVRPNAQAAFTFRSDPAGCNQDTVEVSCNAAGITTATNVNVNCLPDPSSLQLTLAEDTPQHVQLNTSDMDQDTLTVEMKVEPGHGTLSVGYNLGFEVVVHNGGSLTNSL